MSGRVVMDATEAIRQFIVTSLLFGDESALPSNESSLLSAGVIDSTDVLELVVFLESQFGIDVADDEIVPGNFDSLASLTRYATAKRREVGLPEVVS
jgi:acyl carrier protein